MTLLRETPKPISEEEAVQIRLLMDAMAHVQNPGEVDALGRAIAGMHPCESSWWYACATATALGRLWKPSP